MNGRLSDNLITISTMMMIAKERREIIRLSSELNSIIEKAMELEKNSTSISDTINESSALIKFTDKEIDKMPKAFRKTFRVNGCVAHVRKRIDRRYNCSYEIRYARKPFNKRPISVSATTLEKAKLKFIEKLNNYEPQDESFPAVPTSFDGFAMYWFENFHKRKVAEKTYQKNFATYKHDIHKAFEHAKLADILPVQIQKFLEGFNDKERTKETLHSLLNQIFRCAVKHGIVKLNPLDMCFYQKHEREHGRALSLPEEKKLLKSYAGTPFQIDLAVALYTGLRPNEWATAVIDGKFIKARNSKRKNGKTEFKRIPITPMLRPYLYSVTELKMHCPATVAEKLKAVLPNHTLYDMRTTFQTRCTECGIAEVAIGLFMGNAIGSELKKAYTDVSAEWLIKEGEKLRY